jgi:hypothetical protein
MERKDAVVVLIVLAFLVASAGNNSTMTMTTPDSLSSCSSLYNAIVCQFCLELIANGMHALFLVHVIYLRVAAASSNPMCCNDHPSWGSQNQINGCSSNQNDDCNSWCETSCRGGECKLRGGHHKCHCYC